MSYKKLNLNFFLQKRIIFIIVSTLTILGALFVRIYGLSDVYYNPDEAWNIVIANQKTIANVIDYNFKVNIHPPLPGIIWHLMLKISDNDIWLRSASFLPSVLIVPSVYIFGSLLIGEFAGIVMAILAAFGFSSISIGVVVRPYPMMILCLVWAGIFALKYRATPLTKYLVFYFIAMFLTLELNHAAAFMAFTFGTLLMFSAYHNKEKIAFLSITFGHLVLAGLVVGYGYILSHYYGFQTDYFKFITGDSLSEYVIRNVTFFFMVIANIGLFLATPRCVSVFIIVLLFLSPVLVFKLLKNKNFIILHIIFTPAILICITDYLRIYPFYQVDRSNLFLYISAITLFGIISQYLYKYCLDIQFFNRKYSGLNLEKSVWKDNSIDLFQAICVTLYSKLPKYFVTKRKLEVLKATLFISLPILCTLYTYENNKLIKAHEVEWSKDEMHETVQTLEKYKINGNILVTEEDMVWRLLLLERFDAQVTYITKYLGHFKSKNYDFYFTAFPSRRYSKINDLYHFTKFFSDLFDELKSGGKFSSVKNIVYFSFGDSICFSESLIPEFISKDAKSFDKKRYKDQYYQFWKEKDNFAWQVVSSDQVTAKISLSSSQKGFDGGYSGIMTLFAMTPKFIEDNFFNKNFIDWYELQSKSVLALHDKLF